ncbi:MAG: DNA methyltransferase [Candidatus Magasanikbacteria bacterium]|nr:DNA methyltransferase [Candidatus Magasanikbacteria bacterium]
MYKRTRKPELSYPGEKLIRGRHKIHPYPAMLHPLLVDYLLHKYGKKGNVVFDPFCGSGVTLFESAVHGHASVGFEINPLALLIAKTKVEHYDIARLKSEYADFKKTILNGKKIDVPQINNIDYWYTRDIIKDLGKIREVLKRKKYKYKDFFITNFAYICRKQSLTRAGEFKRYRIKKEKIDSFQNKVFEMLFSRIEEMIEIYSKTDKPLKRSKLVLANSENPIAKNIKYDLVITSPPYGDSRTTVAYGEFSSFGADWVSDLNPYGINKYRVDKESLGKISVVNGELSKNSILNNVLNKIAAQDKKRADDVLYFYNGYYNAVKNVVKNLNKDGTACFIVGNRTVKGINIPMDQITASFLEDMKLKFDGIYVRDILNKIMPSKNSPSNITGIKSQTMLHEYIVIFHKN